MNHNNSDDEHTPYPAPVEPEPGFFGRWRRILGRRVGGLKVRDWIVGLLVLLVLPAVLKGLSRQGFQAQAGKAAQQVVVDLQLARKRAIAEKAPFRVVFAPEGGSKYVMQKQDNTRQYQSVGSHALPWGASFGVSPASVEFSPTGTVPSPALIQVRWWSATRSVKIGVQGDMLVQ